MRSQGAYFEGDRGGVIVLCTMFLVSSSIKASIFHSTWLDTFWIDLVYICVYTYKCIGKSLEDIQKFLALFPLGRGVGEALLDKQCEIFNFSFYTIPILRAYVNCILKKHISFSSSPSPAFKKKSSFYFLLWHVPASRRLSSPS